jgi:hypothetical protein
MKNEEVIVVINIIELLVKYGPSVINEISECVDQNREISLEKIQELKNKIKKPEEYLA